MKRIPSTSILAAAMVLGGALLAAAGQQGLHRSGKLATDRNPLAVQGSAYGRLLARLAEDTIDRVWHLGVEQIVPHHISGDEHGHSSDDVQSDWGDGSTPAPSGPIAAAKDILNEMRITKYSRTNPYSLTQRHLATVKREIEGMLLRAYNMDPGHLGAYDSYHLFLTTHTFGGTEQSREHAKTLARATIGAIAKEDEDPEPWLTAATAAMNLFLLETEEYRVRNESVPLDELRYYRQLIDRCLQRFHALQHRSEEEGNWHRLSFERQFEIASRARFTERTFEQFDVLIARATEAQDPSIESEVAEILDSDRR